MHRLFMPLAAATLAASAQAASFDLDTVSPDAAAIVHIDIDALLDSALGPFLEMAAAEASEDLADELGHDIDLLQLVNAVTIYVIADSLEDVEEDQLVIMLDADNNLLELLDMLREEVSDIDKRRSRGYSLEAWQFDEDEDTTLFLNIQEHRNGATLIASFDDDLLVDALDILEDDADSYRDAHGDAFDDADDAMVFLIADLSAAPEIQGPASAILDFAKTVSAMITDQGDTLGLSLSISTDSTDSAEQLGKLVDGLIAFAQFASAAQDEIDNEIAFILDLLDSVSIDTHGNRFTLSLEIPEDILEEILEHADF